MADSLDESFLAESYFSSVDPTIDDDLNPSTTRTKTVAITTGTGTGTGTGTETETETEIDTDTGVETEIEIETTINPISTPTSTPTTAITATVPPQKILSSATTISSPQSHSSHSSFASRHRSSLLSRNRGNSLGSESISTAITNTTVSSVLHPKRVNYASSIAYHKSPSSSSSSLSGALPPPSIFELGDVEASEQYGDEGNSFQNRKESTLIPRLGELVVAAAAAAAAQTGEEGEDEQDRLPDECQDEPDNLATPKLVTPTTTPTAEKFNPIDFLARSSSKQTRSSYSFAPPFSHNRSCQLDGTTIREEGEETDSQFLSSNSFNANPTTAFLELPSPSKYAIDLESERSSITPDNKREDSVYFTAAWASPRDASSSLKSEPSFSPDRDTLSPVGGFLNSQNQVQRASGTDSAAPPGTSATPPVDPISSADTELFVTRLRESIWKSVGKTRNNKSKTTRDFTQDWLSQFLTGVPRTERNNWLSDDETSTQPSENAEREYEEEENKETEDIAADFLGIDDDFKYVRAGNEVHIDYDNDYNEDDDSDEEEEPDDETSTTQSFKTALNRYQNNTDSQSDWLGLEDESIDESLDIASRQTGISSSSEIGFAPDFNTPRASTSNHHDKDDGDGDDYGNEELGEASVLETERTTYDSRRSTVTLKQEDFLALGTASDEKVWNTALKEQQVFPEILENTDIMASAEVDTPGRDDLGMNGTLQLKEPTVIRERSLSPSSELRSQSRSRIPLVADKPLPPPPPPPKEVGEDRTTIDNKIRNESPPVPPKPSPVEIKIHSATEHTDPTTPNKQEQQQNPELTVNTPSASSSNVPFTRPRKRVLWRRRACIIALPIDDQRTDLLLPKQVKEHLAEFTKAGYDIKGWDGPESVDENGRTVTASLSRPVFPDPTECETQWQELKEAVKSGRTDRRLPVQFPDQRVWDAYVQELQEAKLRALGVDLGGPPEPPSLPNDCASPMINGGPTGSTMPLNLAGSAQPFLPAITPPLPTASAMSNPAVAFGFPNPNPFQLPFAPTPVGGKNPSSSLAAAVANGTAAASFGLPGTAPTSAPHHAHAGTPFDMLANGAGHHPFMAYPATPLGTHPPFGLSQQQQQQQQPNGMTQFNGFLPDGSGEPMSAGGLSMAGGYPPYPGGPQPYGLPFNNIQHQQSYFPAQPPPPPQQQQVPPQLPPHQHDQALAADDGPSDEIEINVNCVPEVELAQPLPNRHAHNVSDTLQKGVEESEFMHQQQQHHRQEHLGDFIPENEHYRSRSGSVFINPYDPQQGQPRFVENGVASDIDTNPSINGDISTESISRHLPAKNFKDTLPGYGVDNGTFDPTTGGCALNSTDQIYAPNGYVHHQTDGSQGLHSKSLAAFSPPFSPRNIAGVNQNEISPIKLQQPPVQWSSSSGFRAPSFNVAAPAFNPNASGNALGANGLGNGNVEAIFQPPPRRKSKAIPIRKPDGTREDTPSNATAKPVKREETRSRESIRDSGVEINGVNILDYNEAKEQNTHEKQEEKVTASQGDDATNAPAVTVDGKEIDQPAKPSDDAEGGRQKKTALKPTAKPFEFHPTAPVFEAKPATATETTITSTTVAPVADTSNTPAVPAHVSPKYDDTNSTDADDIDAVMRQLNGDGDDVGIERSKSAEAKEPNRAQFASPLLSSRDATESRSPGATTLKVSKGTLRATSLGPAERPEGKGKINGIVQQLGNPAHNHHVSDYSDLIHNDDADRFNSRTHFFDTRINSIIGGIIDSKLTPLGGTLETIQQALNAITAQRAQEKSHSLSRPTSHQRSLSIDVENSDADDEDDEFNTSQLRSRSPLSRKEARKAVQIKQAVLEALAAHKEAQEKENEKDKLKEETPETADAPQPSAIDLSGVYAALAELKELASKKLEPVEPKPNDDVQKVDFRQVVIDALAQHTAAKEQERPDTRDSTQIVEEQLSTQLQSLKDMLRESEERAEKERRMRKDAQDSLAECQHYIKFAENDGSRQRELAEKYEAELKEIKETRLPEAERLAKECARLQEDQRNAQWTLSELSEKNINLVGRLDECTVANDHLKAQNEKAKAENHELRSTINSLKTQLEERMQARIDLRSRYDKLQEEMILASQELAKERAAWKARDEELSLGNATLKMMYEHEVKSREKIETELRDMESIKAAYEREIRLRTKLESDVADLEQQEKESSKFRVMLSQAQRENGQLNDQIIQLRHEYNGSQKEIARLSREKDTIQSRCDRLKNELDDARENYKTEVDRLSKQLHDIKAKAWVDTEKLELNLADAKANSKAEMERMYQELDDLETRRQEEVERLAGELSDVQKKSKSVIDRLKYDLRFVNNSKQEEINRLRVELEEVQAARCRETERREQQLSALFAKDQAKIDALKHDLNASESLRRIDIQNMQREIDEISSLKAQRDEEISRQAEELKHLRTELAESRALAEKNQVSAGTIESFQSQIAQLTSQHEEELTTVRSELQALKDEHEVSEVRFAAELEQTREAGAVALDDAAEAHEEALARERLMNEKSLNELRERHARALHNIAEDRKRHEIHTAEMTKLREEQFSHLQEKNELLQDKIRHLKEKLEIAKAAAQAAAQAAQNARNSGTSPAPVPVIKLSGPATPPQPSLSYVKGTDEPEKISPQALRESIMVLQDQLQQREQRIEELETQVSKMDTTAPSKLKEKDTEINWLRELLGVRLDDLQDIITTLSLENFDVTAVRDAAIRLKANLEMEQQERERATNGRTFPSLEAITNLAVNSKSLPLAAAAAWGNWRKKGQPIENNEGSPSPSNSSHNDNNNNSASVMSTPSKAAATAQSFFSGLLSPPASIPRRGRSTTPFNATPSRSTTRSKDRALSNSNAGNAPPNPLSSNFLTAKATPLTVDEEVDHLDPMDVTDERPRTPLLKNSSYDHDAPLTNLGEELLRLEADMREHDDDDADSVLSGLNGSYQNQHPPALTARDEAFGPSTTWLQS